VLSQTSKKVLSRQFGISILSIQPQEFLGGSKILLEALDMFRNRRNNQNEFKNAQSDYKMFRYGR